MKSENQETNHAAHHGTKPCIQNPYSIQRAPVIFASGTPKSAKCTPWPRMAGIKSTEFASSHLFEQDRFQKRFEPRQIFACYMFSCAGLYTLARRFHLPLTKAGCTQILDLTIRQRDVSRDTYGSLFRQRGRYVHEEGFDHWEIQQCDLLIETQ